MNPTLLAAAGVYALVFWMVCWRAPAVALLLVFASAPFQNDLSGGGAAKFSFAEINLLLAIPLLLARQRRLSIGPITWPVAAYFLIGVASSMQIWRGKDAINSFLQMFLFLVVVVILFASLAPKPEEVRLALCGLVGVGCFLALMVVAMRQQYVLGMHKNGIGSSLSMALLVCLELWFTARDGWRKYLLLGCLGILAAGLLITLSRGAWLGAGVGVFLILGMRRQWLLMGRAALALAPVIALTWTLVPADQKEYAFSFDSKRVNIQARYDNIDYAKRQFEQNPAIGVGVGLRKQFDATNLVWSTLAETGVLGLLAFGAIHVAFFRMAWGTQRKLDRGDPLYSLVAIGGALVFARLAHGMVDHYWGRGPTMIAWAAAGMATGVYFVLPHRVKTVAGLKSPRARALLALSVIEGERRREAGEPA